MSLRKLFHDLKQSGVTADQLQRCLDDLEIQPVLTAHPTEAKRRAVMNQLRRLDENWDAPEEVLEALWQTQEVRELRVGPMQEIRSALYYFDRTIFETVGHYYETFDRELAAHYPTVKRRHAFLTFGSWVGGDRDGNPYIAPLHHLQIHYLKRWRQSDDRQRTETLRRLLALSVNGIAFGMKSTG
jgi:phosphoenolpyruvate carboxylase